MDPLQFWELSFGEIVNFISANTELKKKELKLSLTAKYMQAKQIVEFIILSFDDKNKYKPRYLWDYYPGLFEKEKYEFEVTQEEENFQRYKEMRETFVNYKNKSLGGE